MGGGRGLAIGVFEEEDRMSDEAYMQNYLHPPKKPPKPAVKVMKDGREICDLLTKAGRDEYESRKTEMHTRQKAVCCLYGICPTCPGKLRRVEAMFEHEDGRGAGGGHRDDRIEIDSKWVNGVAHPECNSWKGSRRIKYNFNDAP
jgi:hypothetical protein